jgi:hypothetical protein
MRSLRDILLAAIAVVLVTGWACGCSKEEEPAPVRSVEVRPPAREPAEANPPAVPPAEAARAEPVKPDGSARPRVPAHITYSRSPGTPGYLPAVMGSLQNSKIKLAVAELTRDINQFYAMNGRYPESLEELEKARNKPLPTLLSRLAYDYNPEDGTLIVVERPREE